MKTNVTVLLAKHKLKVTDARKSLIDLIEQEEHPVDAQFLIEHLQKTLDIDRVTVFRILNILTGHGILRKLEFGEGKARYELAQDEHHHLICESCGAVEKVTDCNIEALQKEIERKKKFHITRHSLEFFGLCEKCFKKFPHLSHTD